MYTEMTINERVKVIRTSSGLTLDKFSERIGVSRAAMSNIENARRNVTDQMFKSICREFNVSEEWLRDGTGDILVIPEDETAALVEGLLTDKDSVFYQAILDFVKTYQQLSPESQKIVDQFVHDSIENTKNRKA